MSCCDGSCPGTFAHGSTVPARCRDQEQAQRGKDRVRSMAATAASLKQHVSTAGDLHFLLVGAAGAAAYELSNLYNLMLKLPQGKFQAVPASPLHYALELGTIVASRFIAWGINAHGNPAEWRLTIAGIGARSIASKPIEIGVARGEPAAAASERGVSIQSGSVSLRDIFG
jgi:hypothetical protein